MVKVFETQLKNIDRKSVHTALKSFHNAEKLGKTPLADLKIVEKKRRDTKRPYSASGYGLSLRNVLVDVIDTLKTEGGKVGFRKDDDVHYQILQARFIENRDIDYLTDTLLFGRREYFRQQNEAFEKVAQVLWKLEESSQDKQLTPIPRIFFNVPPKPIQPLFGRSDVLDKLKIHLLQTGNLATCALSGWPGVGKTTLAIALANDLEVQDHFKGGILWVGLGKEPNILGKLKDWCIALGISPGELIQLKSELDLRNWIAKAVGNNQVLFIVDDAWEIDDAMPFQITGNRCAHLLTTRSQDRALQFSPKGNQVVNELNIDDGLALLKYWAPNITDTKQMKTLVKCVDGLPLGLELMGRLLGRVSHDRQESLVQHIINKLQKPSERSKIKEPFSTLSTHPNLAHHYRASLDLVISISYEELPDDSKLCLDSLSVFPPKPNTFSEDTALSVSKSSLAVFKQVIDLGLIESRGDNRYSLHQTIYDFANGRLTTELPFERMLGYYNNYLDENEKNYNELTKETENIAVVLEHAISIDNHEAIIHITNQYFSFQASTGRYEEAERNLAVAKEFAEDLSDKEGLSVTLLNFGLLENARGDYSLAKRYFNQALSLVEEVGDAEILGSVLEGLGVSFAYLGKPKKARKRWERGLKVLKENRLSEAYCGCLQNLGTLSARAGNYDDSEKFLTKGLSVARENGYRLRESTMLSTLASLASSKGRWDVAEKYSKESLTISQEMGHLLTTATMLTQLGAVKAGQKAYKQALDYLLEALPITQQIGDPIATARLFRNLGETYSHYGNVELSDEHFQKAAMIAREIHNDYYLSGILCDWGEIQVNNQNYSSAKTKLDECLKIAEELNEQYDIATSCFGLGKIAKANNNISEARRLSERSLKIYKEIGHYRAKEIEEWLEQLGDQ